MKHLSNISEIGSIKVGDQVLDVHYNTLLNVISKRVTKSGRIALTLEYAEGKFKGTRRENTPLVPHQTLNE